jgi:EmrB/QacA subfamily drug resistance transporter
MVGAHRPPCDNGLIRGTQPVADGLSPSRKRAILAATILASSMGFIDGSVITVALPAIQHALRAETAGAQWIVNGYMLFLGAFVLVGGALGDRLGRRRIFLIGILLFTLASIGCGVAPSVGVLIGARALQGLGAALLTPTSLAIIGASFDEQERGRAIGTWAGLAALTTAAGPVLGGWLVDTISWRAIFLINVPLALVAIVLAIRCVPESGDDQARGIDWTGAVLVATGLAAVIWALTALPERGAKDSAVIAALIGGVVLLGVFLALEGRRKDAMMPLGLYRSRAFSSTNLLTLFLYFALSGTLFFLPFALIRLGGYSATAAGAALLPFAAIMGLGSTWAGRLADRLGPRPSLVAGPLIAGSGLLLLAFAEPSHYWTGIFPAILVLSIGMTTTVAPLTATVMAAVDQRHAGLASGINNAVARIAALLAVAALGALLFTQFASVFQATGPDMARHALDAIMAGSGEPSPDADRAFASAYRAVILACAACAAAAAAAGAMVGPAASRSQQTGDGHG